MKKTAKMFSAAAGSVVLVIGLMALPAFASGSAPNGVPGSGWFGQMRTFMGQEFTQAQHQNIMNSSAMQQLHNSPAMRQAMQTGNIGQMEALMNSDGALKSQVGQGTINKMDQFMSGIKSAAGIRMPAWGQTSAPAAVSAARPVKHNSGLAAPRPSTAGPNAFDRSNSSVPQTMMGSPRATGTGASMMGFSSHTMKR